MRSTLRLSSLSSLSSLSGRGLLFLRRVPQIDEAIHQHGPSARRMPPAIRERLMATGALRGDASVRVLWTGEPELVIPPPAKAAKSVSHLALRKRRLPAPFLVELADVRLIGANAIPMTRDGRLLLTPYHDMRSLMGQDPQPDIKTVLGGAHLGSVAPALNDRLSAGRVCSLVGRLDVNYYHWIVDTCGRLEAVNRSGLRDGDRPMILVRAHAPHFVPESLHLLGIGADKVCEWPARPTGAGLDLTDRQPVEAKVDRLIVPSLRGYRHGNSPRSLHWLRQAFLAGVGPSEDDTDLRIYIPRRSDGWRTIRNGDAVEKHLAALGFLVIRAEELSFTQQVRLFSRTRLMVGAHGAGLTNILFAPCATLVELRGSYGGDEYFSMASGLGNPYARMECADRDGDLVVDIGRLDLMLNAVETGRSSGNKRTDNGPG